MGDIRKGTYRPEQIVIDFACQEGSRAAQRPESPDWQANRDNKPQSGLPVYWTGRHIPRTGGIPETTYRYVHIYGDIYVSTNDAGWNFGHV
jgi:hypothetical protein